ncbi:MAG TPA: hypothetical protein VM008_01005 [Phycisphaerae bacterium]|nr:hypothetical protein [Phycisphaerae bacterium]
MPEKIMWVIHGDDVYGVKRAIISLMEGVRDAGWIAQAVSLGGGECFDALRQRGFDVISLDMPECPGLQKARSRAGRLWEAAKLAQYQKPVGSHSFSRR